MQYEELKAKLLRLFDRTKLEWATDEWGFFNQRHAEIQQVAYATNISPEVIETAYASSAQLLLTHHDSWDFVFGLKERCDQMLIQYGIAHAFFHAPLDDADFGTSASLAKALHAHGLVRSNPYREVFFMGRIGTVPPMEYERFCSLLQGILGESVRGHRNSFGPIHKIAIVTGAGNLTHELQAAVHAGCDTYITGEYSLYTQQYASLTNMNLFVGSHTNTEVLGVESMASLLAEGTDITIRRIEEPAY